MRFIMIDRICRLETGKRALGIKNICRDDVFLTETFPGTLAFSPVILAESAAQLISWIIIEARAFSVKPVIALVDRFVCSGHTVPGDRLLLEGTIESLSEESALAHARVTIGTKTILELHHAVCYLYPLEALDPPDAAHRQFHELYDEGHPLPEPSCTEGAVPYLQNSPFKKRIGIDALLPSDDPNHLAGVKNITATEPYFNDHFPRKPVTPGVIICESMAGLAALLIEREAERLDFGDRLPVLEQCDKMKFRAFVVPGDQIVIDAQLREYTKERCTVALKATVHNKAVTTALLTFALMNENRYQNRYLTHQCV